MFSCSTVRHSEPREPSHTQSTHTHITHITHHTRYPEVARRSLACRWRSGARWQWWGLDSGGDGGGVERRSRRTVSGSSCSPAGQQRTGRWDAAGLIGGQAGLRSARSASWLAGVRPALGAARGRGFERRAHLLGVASRAGAAAARLAALLREAERAAEVQQLRLGQRLPAGGASGRLQLDQLIVGRCWRLRAPSRLGFAPGWARVRSSCPPKANALH